MVGELVGRAHRDDAARIEDRDLVDAGDGRGTVRDDQDRLSLHEAGQRRLDIGFGFRVGEGRGLVEDEDGGVDEEGSCDRDSSRGGLPPR